MLELEYGSLGGNSATDYDEFKLQIAVVGVGGGGNNTIARLNKMGVKGAELFAFNTDKKQLDTMPSNIKSMTLGQSITYGLGAGGFPEIGEKAANLSRDKISDMISGINLMFLTAGEGGGTGTGAAPVIAEIAKEQGAVIVGVVTIPFSLERVRLDVAKRGVEKLKTWVDTLIVIDNQRLYNLYPNLRIEQAFSMADEITAKAVRGITEAITQPSMINLDFADVRSIMTSGGVSVISVGEGQGPDRIDQVVKETLKNKLLDINCEGATGALFHITGGPDLTLGDANTIGERLTESISQNASVTWGARMDPNYQGKVEVIAIFTGIQNSFVGRNPGPAADDYGEDSLGLL